MSDMDNRGYSQRIIDANLEADGNSLGVLLGRYCISRDIPVADISEYFSVSKMTVYNWFSGRNTPKQSQEERIRDVLTKAGVYDAEITSG
jgi:DNA-binding transcriptional regulator YiaG